MHNLYRLTYFAYNSDGRRVKQHTPWHPSESYIKLIAETYYNGQDVKLETVKCRDSGSSSSDDFSGGFDAFDNMMKSAMTDYNGVFA